MPSLTQAAIKLGDLLIATGQEVSLRFLQLLTLLIIMIIDYFYPF